MRITPQNFFDHYIIDPFSKELTYPEKILALSLSILCAIPFGILHIRAKYLHTKTVVNLTSKYEERLGALDRTAASIAKVSIPLLRTNQSEVAISQKDVGAIVQDKLIKPFYSKALPKEEHVTVPITDPVTKQTKWRFWNSLSRREKIQVNNTGTHPHNQLPTWAPESAVNLKFFGKHGQAEFMPGDPREHHGNDHAARAAILSTVFAYLYHKYAPGVEVSAQDLALIQVVAAGHDSGRQTEGPDVYDEESAKNVQTVLQNLGCTDSVLLSDAKAAIAHKDSNPFETKPLMAKCVQCADSAEYTRLLLSSTKQDESSFVHSQGYLDIFRELEAYAKYKNGADPKGVELKDGMTFGDFSDELSSLRREMNDLIFVTHQQSFRAEVVRAGGNIYNAILETINPTEYPLLTAVLRQIGVKQKPPSAKEVKEQQKLAEAKSWIKFGVSKIATASLENLYDKLRKNRLPEAEGVRNVLKAEIDHRGELRSRYDAANGADEVVAAFQAMPPIMRDFSHFEERMQILDKAKLESTLEYRHHLAKALLDSEDVQPERLQKEALQLLDSYSKKDKTYQADDVQTTCALMLERAAREYQKEGRIPEAKKALEDAAERIRIPESSDFYDLKGLFQRERQGTAIVHTPADCGMLRKRKLGMLEKVIDGKEVLELSVELPPHIRAQLDVTLETLIPEGEKSVKPSVFLPKVGSEYKFGPKNMELGEDVVLNLAPGVELLVGVTKKYYNQRHLVRVRVVPGTPVQNVHAAFAKVGLTSALLPSRKEDVVNELRARSIAFRFPEVAYHDPYVRVPPNELYSMLTDAQKVVVDTDVEHAKLTQVGNGHYEMVIPDIAKEAWLGGVRAVGTFIWGGASMHDTAFVLKNILKNGLLSSQERFQHGILGNGCCPIYNYQSGSGDQVFARVLTKNFLYSKFPMENFAITGKVFVILDNQVLERMPYAYVGDRNGVRNPDYYVSNFAAEKQEPIRDFKGHEMIRGRLGFKDHLQALNKEKMPLNEVMLDLNCGSKYIKKLVVWTEEDRLALIAELQRVGIYEIGGKLIEEVVVAKDKLDPTIVDDYNEENPYTEERLHGTAYI